METPKIERTHVTHVGELGFGFSISYEDAASILRHFFWPLLTMLPAVSCNSSSPRAFSAAISAKVLTRRHPAGKNGLALFKSKTGPAELRWPPGGYVNSCRSHCRCPAGDPRRLSNHSSAFNADKSRARDWKIVIRHSGCMVASNSASRWPVPFYAPRRAGA